MGRRIKAARANAEDARKRAVQAARDAAPPTRYGNMSTHMKQFIDTTGGLWLRGELEDKATVICVYRKFHLGS